MAQAKTGNIAPAIELKPHYALSEERKYNLHLIGRALDGLAQLVCGEDEQTARDQVMPVREDLAAIFEMLRVQLDQSTADLQFLSAHDLAAARHPITVTLK